MVPSFRCDHRVPGNPRAFGGVWGVPHMLLKKTDYFLKRLKRVFLEWF